MKIRKTFARKVLNSRGDVTIEIQINDVYESAPEGASKGSNEAKYIDPNEAVKLYNEDLSNFIKSFEINSIEDIKELEEELKNINAVEKYGANTIIALEFALLRALSYENEIPVYKILNEKPRSNIKILANVIGGGAHTKGKGPEIQEFLISPYTEDLELSIFIASYFHKILGEELEIMDKDFLYGRNDEGAWTTKLDINEIFDILIKVRDNIEKEYGIPIYIGIDFAATQLYDKYTNEYKYKDRTLSRDDQIEYVLELISSYDLFYVEDPLYEEDFEGFGIINTKTDALITGDDLTVTNIERIKKAFRNKSIKGVIIKPNQVGYLFEALEALKLAKSLGITPIFSHRSGETTSDIIADIAYASEVPYVKFGINNGERISKLNRLIRIYEENH